MAPSVAVTLLAATVVLLSADSAPAQGFAAAERPPFTRKPPAPGSTAPRLGGLRAAPPAPAEPAPADPSLAAFWSDLDGAAPGTDRLARAAAAAGAGPLAARWPATEDRRRLRAIFAVHGRAIAESARRHGVSPALLAAVILAESGGRADAVSPKGALGVMQLMPATAARRGVDPLTPDQAIRGGAAHLDAMLRDHGEDAPLALAAWNAGEGAVAAAGGVPDWPETRAFVPRVAAAFGAAAALCFPAPADARAACTAPAALARR
jgi:soluble lytic murein transglycosylase-like protein